MSVLSSGTTGCLATLPPPAPPERDEPRLADAPKEAPAAGQGRVVLDAEGGPAHVSRVTETQVSGSGWHARAPIAARGAETRGLAAMRSEELLCVTPCIVDVRQGAHTFVFASPSDPLRSSAVVVPVTSGTTVVRHSIGRVPSIAPAYAGGALMVLLGGGLTLMGGLATTVGAVGKEPEPRPDGTTKGASPASFLTFGLITLGIGIITGTAGYFIAASHRPVEQAGSTTQWTRP